MGHSSIPSLNKSGQSMFWNSMWDNKDIYSRFLHESLFLQDFIPFFFEHLSYKLIFSKMYKHNFKLNSYKKYKLFYRNKFNYKELVNLSKNKNNRYFFSKIWVIKFQKWVIIYFFFYSSFFLKKKKKHKFKKIKYVNTIIYNYFKNFMKIKFEVNSRKYFLKKKFLF